MHNISCSNFYKHIKRNISVYINKDTINIINKEKYNTIEDLKKVIEEYREYLKENKDKIEKLYNEMYRCDSYNEKYRMLVNKLYEIENFNRGIILKDKENNIYEIDIEYNVDRGETINVSIYNKNNIEKIREGLYKVKINYGVEKNIVILKDIKLNINENIEKTIDNIINIINIKERYND